MKPVVTVAEMRAIDSESRAFVEEPVLVERAGTALATGALRVMGGSYGRRVVVIAGKGNNGADGRVAAARLRRRGAAVSVLEVADAPSRIGPPGVVDLVVDAAFGTGFRGSYEAPAVPAGTRVVAADIPSGVDGDTGEACGAPLRADVTVTFAALKPGLLQGDGPLLAGRVEVADIGLDVSRARIWVVEDADVSAMLPPRTRSAYKWQSAVAVVAGSPGMTGAAQLCARGAYRAGAGMVRLGVPGADPAELAVTEAVGERIPALGWAQAVLDMASRCKAIVVGPGLGRADETVSQVRRLVAEAPVPVVVDADGLWALGGASEAEAVVHQRAARGAPDVVLTPHDGEFARLSGGPPGADRISDSRSLAASTGAVVLLKGPTTVVCGPDGRVLLAVAGSSRLATAGTGDVLSGVIGAFLARGLEPPSAAALAAHVHARGAEMGLAEGLVAGDVTDLVARWLSGLRRG
ncbi:MAG TPA: NAD(P)H-hydrate dehydratase [Acidimicrobiales bacterium]|nr:NAD(P)H-hydrate dehydratase [Acidimicrobiales bacterium]